LIAHKPVVLLRTNQNHAPNGGTMPEMGLTRHFSGVKN
jgi:hypothetical protein